jgi:hypothetical protein
VVARTLGQPAGVGLITVIYFLHDEPSHAIKIGCGWDPRKRQSTLQISGHHEYVLLGTIPGMKRTEKQVHALVHKHCAPKPGETFARPLCIKGEWFDDRILPFVRELMKCPEQFLDTDKKRTERPPLANKDASLHACKLVLEFDSGEIYHEQFVLRAGSPDLASAALDAIAKARLPFLAQTVRVTQLIVPGCPTRKMDLQGSLVTQTCEPRDGLSVIFNSRADNCCVTDGVKQYSNRWLHGVPAELWDMTYPWRAHPTSQFSSLLNQFAQVLQHKQCVISASLPLPVQGLIPKKLCRLPKGELRSKANKKAASKRKRQRSSETGPRIREGIVYFIQNIFTLAIKIGFCLKNPEKRLDALDTGTSNYLRLLGHVLGSELHEKLLHKRFAGHHLKGEWFAQAIAEEVDGILKFRSVKEWLKSQEPTPQALPGLEARAGDPG